MAEPRPHPRCSLRARPSPQAGARARSPGPSGQWPGGQGSLGAQGWGWPLSPAPRERAGGALPGPWRSDQGVFGLEAGGAARAGADAGQHGDLRVAGHPVAASGRVLVFGAQAQDAL